MPNVKGGDGRSALWRNGCCRSKKSWARKIGLSMKVKSQACNRKRNISTKLSRPMREGKKIESEVRTFQTANKETTPRFRSQLSVTHKAIQLFQERLHSMLGPNVRTFLLHPGRLGWDRIERRSLDQANTFHPWSRWSVESHFSRYWGTMRLTPGTTTITCRCPAPEYYYTYSYGNSQFFMIDTNKNVGAG